MDALDRLAGELAAALGADAVGQQQAMAGHTTLRVGGPADLLVTAGTAEALQQAVALAWQRGVPYRVLGSGANVLVADAGVRGVVILNRARRTAFAGEAVAAESGAVLASLARQCIARGLAGLEWAVGIPGTVGGAVVGNAGAWGSDVASTLTRLWVLDPGAEPGNAAGGLPHRREWPVARMEYAYRTSLLKLHGSGGAAQAVVLEAEFGLRPGARPALEARAAEITARRKASQPPGASCGSVFKNPPGDYAGRLIEAAGLKGQRCGGAQISERHANFIVNHGGAAAADVKSLIDRAVQAVEAQFGIRLETEIQLIGDWQSDR